MEMSKLINDMSKCEQTKGMSVLEHGQSVNRYYEDLMSHLKDGAPLKYEWRMPDWIYEHSELIIRSMMPADVVRDYQIFHDCGKPCCKVVDAEGKQHFPNHAAESEKVWLDAGGDPTIGKLIGMDMDVHLLKADDVQEFAARPEAVTLLITGLCEIHSNAAMFGGIESTSFKIKWKHISKRGKLILCKMTGM